MKISTASEWLLNSASAFQTHLQQLGPVELALNLGMTAVALAIAFVAARLLKKALWRAARRTPGPATAEKTVRASRAIRFAHIVLRAAIGLATAYAVARLWGLDPAAILAQGHGQRLVQGGARLTILLVIAVCAFELAGFLIGRLFADLAENAGDIRRAAQLQTLAPILRGLAQTIIIVMAALMLLSEIGVRIGPLLAGAGVVGVAVGFGAQTLVKDFLTGIFLIVEDIVSVGDVVQISGSGGLVEAMTLRTIRLRDFDGTLHVFPYSEAQVIHNLTKSFSYYVFDLQVSYESDIDRAMTVMRATGEALAQDPAFASKILAPIEVVGVDGLGDSGVKLKARIKTRPVEQWNVGREYNRRIKFAFDEAGIQIPYPHLKLVLSQGAPA